MVNIREYLQTWKLKLRTRKTMSAVFHHTKKDEKRDEGQLQQRNPSFCSEPKHLGIGLDRTFTYRRHLEPLRKNLTSGVALKRRLAGSGWVGGATTLRTVTLALVDSTVEHCAAAWCRSAQTRLIGPTINDAWRTETGCLRSALADNLPLLSGILSAELCRRGATLSLSRRAIEPGHLLQSTFNLFWSFNLPSVNAQHLTSRRPFVLAAQHLIRSSDENRWSAGFWADHRWNPEWLENTTGLRISASNIGTYPPGLALPRPAWFRLNRRRIGVRRFCLHKWSMAPSAACECGAEEQTIDHVILYCPIHQSITRTAWPEGSGWCANRIASKRLPRDSAA